MSDKGFVRDAATKMWRSLTKEDLAEEVEARPSRAMIRHYRRTLRRKGPGYTRAMRKGRTQRGSS